MMFSFRITNANTRYCRITNSAERVFALEEAETAGVQGDMPRGKRTGYIFGSETGNARLVAHELGHGAFGLEHTFDTYGITRNSTDNLMDYAGADATHLTVWQWDLVHNPKPVWSFLEGDEDGMVIKEIFRAEVGCQGLSNPFDNGEGDRVRNLLRDFVNTYVKGEKYYKDNFNKLSGNKSEVIGELGLWFSKRISDINNGVSYCANDITISLINEKNEIDLTKREITGNALKAYLTIDSALRITIEEDKGKDSRTVVQYIDKVFSILNGYHFSNSYSGGFAVREDNLNENQRKAIEYFLTTTEGYDFVKQFARKGDVVMDKEFNKNGDFYEKYKIGLIIQTKLSDSTTGSNFSIGGLEEKSNRHFTINLSQTGFGSEMGDIDILEALLHECFLHGHTYVKDYSNNKIDYDNICPDLRDKKYEPHNHHYHFTRIISTFKGEKFNNLPNSEILLDSNGNNVIGLAYWPIKSFDILKRYANGRLSDYKIQNIMMHFSGSNISISETTGKIEDTER